MRALTAVFGFLVTARTLIRVTSAEMRRLATTATADNPRWPRLQRPAAVLSGSNLLLAVGDPGSNRGKSNEPTADLR